MRGFMVSPGERRLLRFSLGSLHTPRGFVLRRKHQNNVKGARLKLWGEGFELKMPQTKRKPNVQVSLST